MRRVRRADLPRDGLRLQLRPGCAVERGAADHVLEPPAELGVEVVGLGRVQVFVAPENVAALRLAKSAGFQREGVLRSYLMIDGQRVDAVVLARLP